MRTVIFIKLIIYLTTVSAYNGDIIIGRRYIPQQDYFSTIQAMRDAPMVQQLFYLVLTPLQTLSTTFFSFLCSIISIFTTSFDALRVNIFGYVTTLVANIPLLPVSSVQTYLTVVNGMLANITRVLSNYGCVATNSVDTTITDLINALIGTF